MNQVLDIRAGVKIEKDCWFLDHTLSIGYYAITDFSGVIPQADWMSDSCSWFDVDKIPSLVFDHNEMFAEALRNTADSIKKVY